MFERFPIFVDLSGRRVVVVGAGQVATAKLPALRAAGADLVVIAPQVSEAIASSGVEVRRRPFAPSDLDEAWFVVAAAPPEVNRQVAAAAAERRIFVNAVDDPAHATAYLGGVVRRDGITLAISTDGAAPALAGLLREGLDSLLPRDLARWMAAARWQRAKWKRDGVPMEQRRPRLLEALNELYADNTEAPAARARRASLRAPQRERAGVGPREQ
jgi:uroporphyrin-III C-methyltransferase/precorrin-2 dehydrogenase/sirohydrochlorin ferrochelatase